MRFRPREEPEEEVVAPEVKTLVESGVPPAPSNMERTVMENGPKPGWKTTEFLGVLVVQLLLWVNASMPEGIPQVEITDNLTAVLSASLMAAYAAVRGWTKTGPRTTNVVASGAPITLQEK